MKLFRILASTVAIACLTVTTTFAAPDMAKSEKSHDKDFKQKRAEFEKDPIKALKNRKAEVQSLFNDGKMTKEKADAITARIDARIKEINEFNKLSVQEKRVKLTNDFKTFIDKRVKEGRLTKEEADIKIKDFTDKVTKWDGKGYPKFHEMRHKGKCGQHGGDNKTNQ
jgi:hypothetical protein